MATDEKAGSKREMSDLTDPDEEDPSAGEVIFYRKKGGEDKEEEEEGDENELWDDKELIKAYNKAVDLAYDAVSGSLKGQVPGSSSGKKPHLSEVEPKKKSRRQRTKKPKSKQWKAGDVCLAVYSGDGESYEAKIKTLDRGECLVEFLGYGESETVSLSALQPVSGEGGSQNPPSVDTSMADETLEEDMVAGTSEWTNYSRTLPTAESRRPHSQIPVLPPPPPPNWLSAVSKPPSDQEALSSMLMSWYMSGYHTGYYQALREVRGDVYSKSGTNFGQKGVQSNRRREEP